MPREITDAIATLFLPPASPLLLVALGAVLAWRRRVRAGAALAALGAALLWIACLPVVGLSLVRLLEPPPATEASFAGAQAIVVLGAGRIEASPEYEQDVANGEALGRLRYAARLARKTGLPLLVSGGKPYGGRISEGETMAQVLAEDFRAPVRWIEGDSHTTAQNATGAFALLQPEGRTRILLVTSAVHLRRAELAFRKAGFEVIGAPSVYASRHDTRALDWLPSARGLAATRAVLWEILGIAWYRLKGAA
jgi:uncharacterized SAM-binding protein YcdF (DUF218 family)